MCNEDGAKSGPPARRNPLRAEPFLQQSSLPCAEVLTAETIERAFAENDALYPQGDTFPTPIMLGALVV